MAEDSGSPAEGDADPPVELAATQQNPTGDTEPNTQQPTIDWEARYRALQADHTRKAQEAAEARRQLAELTAQADEAPDDEGQQPRRVRSDSRYEQERQARIEAQWTLAESIHGAEVTEAYEQFAPLWEQAVESENPADILSALEAYHALRSGTQAPPPLPTGTPTRTEAIQPRIDANRSDAALTDDYDMEVEAARQMGPGDQALRRVMRAAFRKAGL